MRRLLVPIGVVALIVAGLWWWQRQREVPLPPQAIVLERSINSTIARTTTIQGPWPQQEVRDFYQRALPAKGWRYCGTQVTPGCTNLFPAIDPAIVQIDVYRRVDDSDSSGPTIEIWPQPGEQVMVVKLFESRAQ